MTFPGWESVIKSQLCFIHISGRKGWPRNTMTSYSKNTASQISAGTRKTRYKYSVFGYTQTKERTHITRKRCKKTETNFN